MKGLLFYLPNITNNVKFVFSVQILVILFWALVYQIFFNTPEDLEGKVYYDNSLNSLIENIYFSTLTFFSVGYGGIRPVSIPCKFVCVINMFITAYLLAYTLSRVSFK